MATSEYCSCPPRLPTPTASHVAIASGVNHRVTSPRWTSARSYAGQFPTRYFVLYLGCTLDFTSRSCPFGRHDGQGRDEHLFPRTNAMASDPASSPTVEEALRSAAARFTLLTDVLELQALGIERADQPVGPEGSRALAETARQAVGDLQRLLSALPVDLLNWSDAAKRQGGRHP